MISGEAARGPFIKGAKQGCSSRAGESVRYSRYDTLHSGKLTLLTSKLGNTHPPQERLLALKDQKIILDNR